jgi:hypothetical protein
VLVRIEIERANGRRHIIHAKFKAYGISRDSITHAIAELEGLASPGPNPTMRPSLWTSVMPSILRGDCADAAPVIIASVSSASR